MITYLKTHVFYVAILLVLAVCGWTWLKEHDARLLADQQVKVSEARNESLQKQIDANQQLANATITELKRRASSVKTPQQALIAIPDVSALPINARTTDDPSRVTVDVVPLFQELSQCKQDAVELNSCKVTTRLMTEQLVEKDTEIKALKKKPGFWKRVGGTLKTGGVGVIIGIAIKAALL